MNICKVCSEIVPLVGGSTLRLTGEEDIYLCPRHGKLMTESIQGNIFLMRMNEATKSTTEITRMHADGYSAVAR
jgi:hypothetical protein